jgi:hypothetical protein
LMEPLRLYDKGIEGQDSTLSDTFAGFRAQIRDGQIVIPNVTSGEPLRSECESFLARIRGDSNQVSNGWAGAEVVAALVAADSSLRAESSLVRVETVR